MHLSGLFRQPSQEVLHDEDGRVDDDPEVDCAHRDQIRRNSSNVKKDEGAEKRKWNDGGDGGGGGQVSYSEEEEEHEKDERNSFHHVPSHRMERSVDEIHPVVV